MKQKFNILECTEEEYNILLQSGIGHKQFIDFPVNIHQYNSQLSIADAQMEFYKAVRYFHEVTSASVEDIINALLHCQIDIAEIQKNYANGLLNVDDIYVLMGEFGE